MRNSPDDNLQSGLREWLAAREAPSARDSVSDDALLAALREALAARDAVPASFVEAGKSAYAWHNIDAELAKEGVIGDLDFDREARRLVREGPDRRRFGPSARGQLRITEGVERELGQLRVDMVPCVGTLPGLDERSRHGLAGGKRLAQRRKQEVVRHRLASGRRFASG